MQKFYPIQTKIKINKTTTTPPMNIKDKILDILNNSNDYDFIAEGVTREYFSETKAAKELEILFLQSHVDLLNECNSDNVKCGEDVSYNVQNKITELNNRIKELSS